MPSAPRVLFVPVSGPKGSGEYVRCAIIAEALRAARPDVEVRFVLNRHAPYARDAPFDTLLVDDTPTKDVDAVLAHLRRERPAVVVFDNAGRAVQLRCAREVGARVAYVSRRPGKRMRAFRPSWARHLDQHWLAFPIAVDGPPTRLERWVGRRFGTVEILALDSIYTPSDAEARARFLASHGIGSRPYVLVVPGGGGRQTYGRGAPEIFRHVAMHLADGAAIDVVSVSGADAPPRESVPGNVRRLGRVAHPELMHLVHDAHLVVGNGGTFMTQVLAHGKVLVAVPLAPDQPLRVRRLAKRGALVAAPLEADRIVEAATELLSDPARHAAVERACERLAVTNGVDRAVDAIERLLRTGPDAVVPAVGGGTDP